MPAPTTMQLLRTPGPLRSLAATTLVNTFGNGLLMTAVVLYFTHVVRLSGAQVGAGLTIAGGLGLLVGVPLGHLADRRGPRELLVVLTAAQALATAALLAVDSFAMFLAVVCVAVTLDRGASAVRQGLIPRVLAPQHRVAGRAFLRAVTNVGFGAGAAVAGLAILADTRAAYDVLIAGDAVTFAAAALLLLRLPRVSPLAAAGEGPRLIVLRDRPYLVVTGLVAILSLNFVMLDVGLPLWVQGHTEAPRAVVAVIFVVNCLMVAALQVRFSRGSATVPGAARACARAGIVLAASCLVFAAASGPAPAAAAAILLVGGLIQVTGELLQAGGGWGLGFGLAPEHAQGQYQGASETGFALAQALGPALMAAVTSAGLAGWAGLAAVFVAAGLATPAAARWALAHRERADAAAEPASLTAAT